MQRQKSKLSLCPTTLSRELLECPDIPAVLHRRGWRRLEFPSSTEEQEKRPEPQGKISPGDTNVSAANTKIPYVKTKLHEKKRHAAALITKRRQVAARDLTIFAQQKRIYPDFIPHKKVHITFQDRDYLTCSNPGCTLRILLEAWHRKRIEFCKGQATIERHNNEQRGALVRKSRRQRSGGPEEPIYPTIFVSSANSA